MEDERYDRRIFAKNLQKYLDMHEIKPIQLAEYLNVAKSTVSSWLSAQKTPRMDKVCMMAAMFGVNYSDLIEESPAISEDDKALLEEVMANPELLNLLRMLKQIEPERLAALAKLVEPLL